MSACCSESTDVIYPMLADIYYPSIEQSPYGNVVKEWMLDTTIACAFNPPSTKAAQEVQPNVNITVSGLLIGRTRKDIRISSTAAGNSITNVILTNIRDKNSNQIYIETSGPRAGKSTIFEIATNEPIVGPFGSVEYYKVVIRRSENQAVNV